MHISKLKSGRDAVVPFTTGKTAVVSFSVLRLSILSSKRTIRGTGFFLFRFRQPCFFFGFKVILSFNRFCNLLNLLSSSTFADEHESASIFSLMPLISIYLGCRYPIMIFELQIRSRWNRVFLFPFSVWLAFE